MISLAPKPLDPSGQSRTISSVAIQRIVSDYKPPEAPQVDYLALVFAFVAAAQRTAGCELAVALPEEAAAALAVLQESETHITALLAGVTAARRPKSP